MGFFGTKTITLHFTALCQTQITRIRTSNTQSYPQSVIFVTCGQYILFDKTQTIGMRKYHEWIGYNSGISFMSIKLLLLPLLLLRYRYRYRYHCYYYYYYYCYYYYYYYYYYMCNKDGLNSRNNAQFTLQTFLSKIRCSVLCQIFHIRTCAHCVVSLSQRR